jgi:putative transposase
LYQGRYKNFVVQDDLHWLVVLRYVERNALRAKLVTRAESWRWGSLHARVNPDHPLTTLCASGPVPLPRNWVAVVNAPQDAAEELAVSQSIYRGRPYGSDRWQRQIAKRLGLTSCFRRPGRPRSRRL